MRLYGLVEAGDPEAVDVYLCEQDAQRALEDCLATNHSGVGCCVSRKSSSRARACHRTNRSNSQRGRSRAGGKARSLGLTAGVELGEDLI